MKFIALLVIIPIIFAATCDDGKTTCAATDRCCCPETSDKCDCCKSEALCCRHNAASWCCNKGLTCGAVSGECISGNKCPDGTNCKNTQKCCLKEREETYFCCNTEMTCCARWCCPRNRRCGRREGECQGGPY